MRKMKDSGIKWAPSIAECFTTKRLKYILFDRNEKNTPIITNDILSLTAKQGVVPLAEKESGGNKPKEDLSLYRVTRPGDIVMNCMNVISGSVAMSNYFGCLSPVYYTFRTIHPDDEERYFNYIFQTHQFQRSLVGFANGILIKESSNGKLYTIRIRVSTEMLGSLYVPYTSPKNQRMIADFLDSKCAEIDALCADIQAEIDTLEEYKRSVITETVTKGLDPNAPMKDSGIPWAPQMPKNWNVMANKYVMSKYKTICSKYHDEAILSLTMDGVIIRDLEAGGKMPKSFDGYQYIFPGNLLMCLFDYDVTPRCIGQIENYGVTSPAYSQFVMSNGNCSKYYYYYYLMIDNKKELLHLAKNLRHSFTEEQLGMINSPVPPIPEQRQIADFLDAKCAEIDATIAEKRESITTLSDYKKSLIYEYVTGKKEVPHE